MILEAENKFQLKLYKYSNALKCVQLSTSVLDTLIYCCEIFVINDVTVRIMIPEDRPPLEGDSRDLKTWIYNYKG